MKKALSAFLFLIFALTPHVVAAQQTALAIVVQSCGTAPYTYVKGQRQPVVQDVNGNVCTTAAVTASISGFHAESSLTPITATTGGVSSSSFTAGKTILVSNTGLTNTAYCSPGASATTASAPILPGQSVAITTVAETAITCITSTSTTAVSFQVGTGLATGWGGSGAGGSSSITSWAGGTLGAMANYGTSPGAVLVPGVNAFVTNTNANGQAVSASSSPVVIASDQSAFPVNAQPATSGGLSNYFVQPTASDNHAVIKAGAGQVFKISITNNSVTVNYVRLYNATTGFNGCNSATNLIYANAIPANAAVGGIADSWNQGLTFATGISICVTSGYATTDTTAATASAMNVNIGYK